MATDMGTVNVDAEQLMKRVTFTVKMKHARRLAIRMWLALAFIRIAVWISGANFEFERLDMPAREYWE